MQTARDQADLAYCSLAAKAGHTEWLAGYRKREGYTRRMKTCRDGTVANIGVEWDDLSPSWRADQIAQFLDYVRPLRLALGAGELSSAATSACRVETASAIVHRCWCEGEMQRGLVSQETTMLMVPYEDLPEDQKERDRAVVRVILPYLTANASL